LQCEPWRGRLQLVGLSLENAGENDVAVVLH
jgi:hypothetical protein